MEVNMSDKDKTIEIKKGYPPSKPPPPGRKDYAGAVTPKTPKPAPKKD